MFGPPDLIVVYFKKTKYSYNAFPVYDTCYHETFLNKWCLRKSVLQTENRLERGFVKYWLNSV